MSASHYERYGFYTYFDSMALQILKQLEKFNESPTGEHIELQVRKISSGPRSWASFSLFLAIFP